jgi:hypothetical protein
MIDKIRYYVEFGDGSHVYIIDVKFHQNIQEAIAVRHGFCDYKIHSIKAVGWIYENGTYQAVEE